MKIMSVGRTPRRKMIKQLCINSSGWVNASTVELCYILPNIELVNDVWDIVTLVFALAPPKPPFGHSKQMSPSPGVYA